MPKVRGRSASAPRRFLGAMIALGAAGGIDCADTAQAVYPDRPIKIVVPFAAGGPADEVARLLANALGPQIDGPVIIENKAGASGNIGMAGVARAEPDGYTLLITSNAITTNPSFTDKLPFDPVGDFAPIVLIATTPTVFAVHPSLGISTLAELITLAKQKPDLLNYASPGYGTSAHLAIERLKLKAGINMVHVNFAGSGPALQAVVAGTVQVFSGALPTTMPQIEAGTVKALAVTSEKRWRELPRLPTMIELCFPGFMPDPFFSMLAPAKTPPEIVGRLAKASIDILGRPEMIKRLNSTGFEVVAGDPEALRQRIAYELPFWKALTAEAGIKPR